MPPTKLRVFFGHDYFGGNATLLRAYRRKLERGCWAAGRALSLSIEALYGSTKLTTDLLAQIRGANGDMAGIREGRFWPRIEGLIRVSDFAIFDLTLPGGPDTEVNWNVLMELGVAHGARLPVRAIVKNRQAVLKRLTNLAGTEIEECVNVNQLGMLVKELVVAFHGGR